MTGTATAQDDDTLFQISKAGVSHESRAMGRGEDRRAYQRILRDQEAARDPRQVQWDISECRVAPVSRRSAQRIIVRYEWLGHMRGIVQACYGLIAPDGEILGVVVFGPTANPRSGDVCGERNRKKAMCLRRGACVHYAPPHAASYLIAAACRQAHRDFGWSIFMSYADEEAGEIGTVYQACNWLYIGKSNAHSQAPLWVSPEGGEPLDQRNAFASRGWTPTQARDAGWTELPTPRKHRYIHFEGSRTKKRALSRSLVFPVLPYPKRVAA